MNNDSIAILNAFICELIKEKSSKNVLLFDNTRTFLLESLAKDMDVVTRFENIENEKYELIIGIVPLKMNKDNHIIENRELLISSNLYYMNELLRYASDDCDCYFLMEPRGFSTKENLCFLDILSKKGWYLNAYINLPMELLKPETSINPIFSKITKTKANEIKYTEIIDLNQTVSLSNAISNINDTTLKTIAVNNFFGFERIKIDEQIKRLETQYNSYQKHSIKEIAVSINTIKGGDFFTEKQNAVYIPRIGNSPVIFDLSNARLKHHNYFQIVLTETVKNEYLSIFFQSVLGKMILSSLTSQSFINHLNKKELEQAYVAIPNLEEQESIIIAQKSINELRNEITLFENELAMNPLNARKIYTQISKMIESIKILSDSERIKKTAREGESKYIEFKQTLSLNIKTEEKDKNLELAALKTIVAFLNTDGGYLYIGIADNGEIPGIDYEIQKLHKSSNDNYLKHFKNLIHSRIGPSYYPFIEQRLLKVDNFHIIEVNCKRSEMPCFLDETSFYVRTNPATDKLEGKKQAEYISNHFYKRK